MLNPLNKLFPRGRRVRRLALLAVVVAAVWVQHDVATAQWRGRLWGNLVLATAQAKAIGVADGQTQSICTDRGGMFGQCDHHVQAVQTSPLIHYDYAPQTVCRMWGIDWLGLPIHAVAPIDDLDLQINILALDRGAARAYNQFEGGAITAAQMAKQPVPPITEPHVQHLLDALADTIGADLAVRPGITVRVTLTTRPGSRWATDDPNAYRIPMIQAGPAVAAYLRHQLGADAARVTWDIRPALMHGPDCLEGGCYQEIHVVWGKPGEPVWCADPAHVTAIPDPTPSDDHEPTE